MTTTATTTQAAVELGAPAPRRLSDRERAYMLGFYEELVRFTSGRRTILGVETDEVIGYAVSCLVTNLADKMVRYPDPAIYARMRLRSAALDIIRRWHASGGRGARGSRSQVSLDLVGSIVDRLDLGETPDPCDLIGDRGLLAFALESLTLEERTILWLVHVDGYTVTEVASLLGRARETVSRKMSRAIKSARHAGERATAPAA